MEFPDLASQEVSVSVKFSARNSTKCNIYMESNYKKIKLQSVVYIVYCAFLVRILHSVTLSMMLVLVSESFKGAKKLI